MKFVVDVNLSRNWLSVLQGEGHDAVYWNDLGDPSAADSEIMDWAREHDAVVLTCDLDFITILAASSATKPSVVQFRPGRHRPALLMGKLLLALRRYTDATLLGCYLRRLDDPIEVSVRAGTELHSNVFNHCD